LPDFFFESSAALIILSFVEINGKLFPVFALSIVLFFIARFQIDQMPSVLIPYGSVLKQISKLLSIFSFINISAIVKIFTGHISSTAKY
jgi:hypothetical protein